MSNTKRRIACAAGALGLVAAGVVGWGPAAQAAPPESLATFAAASVATPYAINSRVPAQTDGGFLFSKSTLQLGKSTSMAAGLTFGELGDLFIVSSAPPGTITSIPTVINAQDPPSNTAPREAQFTGGRSGGQDTGQVRNFDLTARANDAPTSGATAAGQSIDAGPFRSGGAISRSSSRVDPDGSVVTEAVTSLSNVVLGTGPTALTFTQLDSIATVRIPLGGKPETTLRNVATGAALAGFPVTIDSRGISLEDQVAIPADGLSAFQAALDSMAEQGLKIFPAPRTVTVDKEGASVSGAVFGYGYRAPDALPRPSDIGADETFLVGSVSASATARKRVALAAPPIGPPPSAVAPEVAAPVSDLAPPAAPFVDAPLPAPAIGAAAPRTVGLVQVPAPGEPDIFALPARVANPLPGEARNGYRFVLLAALGGVFTVVLVLKRAT